jgi:hypothetical protein
MVASTNDNDPFRGLDDANQLTENQLTALFEFLPDCLPRGYSARQQKLVIECSTMRSGSLPEFLVTIIGHPKEFRFDKTDLESYILQRKIPLDFSELVLMDSRDTAIECTEAGLIHILQTTGHGEIAIVFTKGAFLCRVTVSHHRRVPRIA